MMDINCGMAVRSGAIAATVGLRAHWAMGRTLAVSVSV